MNNIKKKHARKKSRGDLTADRPLEGGKRNKNFGQKVEERGYQPHGKKTSLKKNRHQKQRKSTQGRGRQNPAKRIPGQLRRVKLSGK